MRHNRQKNREIRGKKNRYTYIHKCVFVTRTG